MKKKTNKYHYHEALDRTSMIQEMINNHLSNHPVYKKHKSLAKKLEKVQELLENCYQKIGNKS